MCRKINTLRPNTMTEGLTLEPPHFSGAVRATPISPLIAFFR